MLNTNEYVLINRRLVVRKQVKPVTKPPAINPPAPEKVKTNPVWVWFKDQYQQGRLRCMESELSHIQKRLADNGLTVTEVKYGL